MVLDGSTICGRGIFGVRFGLLNRVYDMGKGHFGSSI